MHKAKIIKDFAAAKDKDGTRKFGWDPTVGKTYRLKDHDYEIFKREGLVGDVDKPPASKKTFRKNE